MTDSTSLIRGRTWRLSVVASSALLLAGCEKRIQWSPDGRRAAVLTTGGVFLSNGEGRLSKRLLPRADAVAWFADSERLAVATSSQAEGGRLAIARVEGDELVVGRPLYTGSSGSSIVDIRVAPGDRTLAFTTDDTELLVVPCDGSSAPAVVAERASVYPDWSPDGRALVYFEPSGPPEREDELGLGTLVRRGVADDRGRIEIDEEPRYLAGTLHSTLDRVRCLRDGSVLFSSAEVHLPLVVGEAATQREQLYLLDASRQGGLVRLIPQERREELPRHLSFFEVSPDESQVLFGTLEGDVHVLSLGTGEVDAVQSARGERPEEMQTAPVWRGPGEFSYLKRLPAESAEGRSRPVVALWRNGQEVLLSEGWSDDFLADLVR